MRLELIKINDLYKYWKENSILVDLREQKDYMRGHIVNAVNIPYSRLNKLVNCLYGYENIFLYCYHGTISLLAARELYGTNAVVYDLHGGISCWKGPLVK